MSHSDDATPPSASTAGRSRPETTRIALLRLLEASASTESLAEIGRVELRDCLELTLDTILTRPIGEPRVAIESQGDALVVTLVNDDRPFLLDSVLGEINARGLDTAAVLHPIVVVARDPEGRMTAAPAFASRTSARDNRESIIVIVARKAAGIDVAELRTALLAILDDVRRATSDWQAMLERLAQSEKRLLSETVPAPYAARAEARELIRWLTERNFTLLGLRRYRFEPGTGPGAQVIAVPEPASSLGILRNPALQVLKGPTPGIELASTNGSADPALVIVAKSDIDGRVHRRTPLDYIGIPDYDLSGQRVGELRLVGLFTSQSLQVQPADIPVVRQKTAAVLAAAGAPEESHDGKAMRHILATLPRDELFALELPDLQRWTHAILSLELRPRVRVLGRADRFGRFVSLLVFAPRERWNTSVREAITALLETSVGGRVIAFTPYFPEGHLVRAHFVVARPDADRASLDERALETSVSALCRTWDDEFIALDAGAASGSQKSARFAAAFPPAYRNAMSPAEARTDLTYIGALSAEQPVRLDLLPVVGDAARVRAKVFRLGDPLRLSERVPLLENLGFSVIDESTYVIAPDAEAGRSRVTLHAMELETANRAPLSTGIDHPRLEDAFDAIFRGAVENDNFNQLVMAAGATWREAAIVRAFAGFLRQLGVPFGLRLIGDTCVRHAGVTRDLLELFHARLNPAHQAGTTEARAAAEDKIKARIESALQQVPSMDEDRILRHLLNLVTTTLRTNAFRPSAPGALTLTFKFDSKAIEASPSPRPYREIWVSGPEVDGVHLRFGPVARGGIRWSDRAQDFRTEVLGLVRAQVVKNAVIVPTGSKGGFYPKQLPRTGSRESIQAAGQAAYTTFISALVDLTDNLDGTRVIHPADVVRHDADDPYLVVAADKGTATFSDTANAISARHGFWLGDAFASGGSVGYDHKKMGITARGAWESVKRHFRDMNRNIDVEPFDVVGVGDMSGDVFGNGMLLSPAIRLIAAFDHRDIFIDPSPDTATSFAERKRLFGLPRSSWQDYDKTKLSRGGGVFSRTAKTIELSPEARARIGLTEKVITPSDVMRAILKCSADLLWLGGIGTYVRATSESNDAVGDRANDAIRITGTELGVKVVGEGANLGLTQKARIEFAAAGGRLNTDFIDNSAGVNSSDIEVNFKIALQPATISGALAPDARATFLASLTSDVAAACLQNNYRQSLALSLTARQQFTSPEAITALAAFLETRGALDRRLESIPANDEIRKRIASGQGLTRPELSVLLSFAKLELTEDIVASRIPDAPFAQSFADSYFPGRLREKFADGVAKHRLRREIIATALANVVLNRGGAAFVAGLAASSGKPVDDIILAYVAASDVCDAEALFAHIDSLDNKIPGSAQLDLYLAVSQTLSSIARALLMRGLSHATYAENLAQKRSDMAAFKAEPESRWPAAVAERIARVRRSFVEAGAPETIAAEVARLGVIENALDVSDLARGARATFESAAKAFFDVAAVLHLAEIEQRAAGIKPADAYESRAVSEALTQLRATRDSLVRGALSPQTSAASGDKRHADLARMAETLLASPGLTPARLLVHALETASHVRAPTA